MRLLFVSHRSDVSGGEICLQRVLEHLKEHDILVALPEGAFADRLQQAGIAVHIDNGIVRLGRGEQSFSVPRMALRFPGVVFRLRKLIRQFKADLVISNALGPLPYVAPASRLGYIPNICIHHHPVLQKDSLDAKVVGLVGKICDGFIAVSEAMSRGLQVAGVNPSHIRTIYNGLDLECYAANGGGSNLLRSQLQLGPEVKLIGLVATISESKGHHVMIEAARLLRDEFQIAVPWRMVFVGGVFENSKLGGEYKKRLESQIAQDKLQDVVLFAGKQSDMCAVYADLDIVVNASTEPEPLGTTIYEAMAMGKPVIASNFGGSPEIVDEGRAGFLVPPDDARALAKVSADILQNKVDCAPMVSAGIARVRQLFDLRNTVREYGSYFGTFAKKS